MVFSLFALVYIAVGIFFLNTKFPGPGATPGTATMTSTTTNGVTTWTAGPPANRPRDGPRHHDGLVAQSPAVHSAGCSS